MQDTPGQWHAVASFSDQELRTPVGSESTAAFKASRESPSELREAVGVTTKKRKSDIRR